ncbi:dipeptide/oligopeptide/nickel ABC transporter ATP-binding protein [Spirochaetia bacterium]|nr:dipeptide/oligopeptide/nickel ABC transporter ATP-binding protein [Spirochaetia bacterium]
MTPLLRVENLTVGIKKEKRFLTAVDDISFDIQAGEILGIVGESGCGKSLTALSIPALLPEAAAIKTGKILFNGIDLRALSQQKLYHIRGREISMVFQEPVPSLNPLLKIGRQIAEPLVLHGETDRVTVKRQVLDIMRILGLREPDRIIEAYPHQLSGGMCQRVMIALAIICKPKLLIADEPTTALDVTIQAQILDLMKKINRELGTSILFISHDLSVINRLCDNVQVMYAGKLIEGGTAADVFTRPVHEYTRGLIGSIPARDRKGRALASIPGKVPSLEEKNPAGCPFAPRCARAQKRCFDEFPAKTTVDSVTIENSAAVVNSSENRAAHQVHCILAEPEANHAGR